MMVETLYAAGNHWVPRMSGGKLASPHTVDSDMTSPGLAMKMWPFMAISVASYLSLSTSKQSRKAVVQNQEEKTSFAPSNVM